MKNSGHLTWVRLQQPQEQHYPFLPVCATIYFCVSNQWYYWMSVFGIFNVHSHVDACNCTWKLYGTVRESAVKADSGRKIHCCAGESNSRHYHAWLFVPMLYQMSHFIFIATDPRDVSLTVSAWYFCFAADTTSKVTSGHWAVCSMNC